MKRVYIFILSVIFSGIVISCSRPGDVLVSYTNGSISRKEFYEWLTMNKFEAKTVLKSKDQQKLKLLSLAIEKISIEEAKKAGFDQKPEISVVTDISRQKIVSQEFLEKQVFTNEKATETVILTDSLFFRKKDNKFKNVAPDSLPLVLKDLSNGIPFVEVSRKYADGLWVVKKSFVVTPHFIVKEYADAVHTLKKGEYTKTPVVSESGTYVIFDRDEKAVSLADTHVQKKDDGIPYQLVATEIRDKAKDDLINRLSSKAATPLNMNAPIPTDKKSVLYSIGGKTMTVADFDTIYSVFTARLHNDAQKNSADARKTFLKDIYDINLVFDEAVRTKFESPELKARVDHLCDSIISREYITSVVGKNIVITDKDVSNEIALHQMKRNSSRNSRAPYKEESPENIRKMLLSRATASGAAKWREEKLKEYHVSVNTSALEGK